MKKGRIVCHPVWQYLSWDVNNAFITCNLCQQKYSQFQGHFITNHKDEWAIIEQQQTIKPIEPYGKKDMNKILHFNSLLMTSIFFL